MSRPLDEIITWNRGVHLRGTPLWLDPDLKHDLAALTGLPGRRLPAHTRTLASPGVAAALARLGAAAPVLPAEFGRWVGIGGVQIQTVDLGMEPEGEELASGVLVGVSGRRILFTGALRRQDARWPAAEHVVARLVAPGHRGADLNGAIRAVASFVRQAHDDEERAVLVVDAVDLAGVLARELSLRGVQVAFAGRLGRLMPDPGRPPESELEQPRAGASVVLRTSDERVPARGRLGRVDTGLCKPPRGRAPDATFRLKWYADPAAVARLVGVTRATGLTLLGAGQAQLEAVREQLGPTVTVRGLGQPQQLDLQAAAVGARN